MKTRMSLHLRILCTAVFALLASASLAHAQATRTWVSGVGDDANPCSRTAPCKTFAGAIAKTAPCGEIDVLDPGGFGALTITKCISIEADGLIAGVLVSGTNGFVVAAGANDVIMIRGLTFEGLGTGLNGIRILSGAKTYITDCHINNFTTEGVDFEPTTANSQLFITNTTIRNNGNFAANTGGGVLIKPTAGGNATIIGTHLQSNVVGMLVQDGAQVSMKDSEAAGNKFAGLNVTTVTTGAGLFLNQVMSVNNGGTGVISTGTGAVVRMSEVSVTNNLVGVNNAATVGSFSNNWIAGNTTDLMGNAFTVLTIH